jgi:hypothetical protein
VAGWVYLRRRKKKERERARNAVEQVVPEDWARRVSSAMAEGEWKQWVIGGAALWVLLRLAEVRQLRRLNRAALVRAAPA